MLGSPVAWLTRIARNGAIDRIRVRTVRRHVDATILPDPAHPEGDRAAEPVTSMTPEALLVETTTDDVVRGALRSARHPAATPAGGGGAAV